MPDQELDVRPLRKPHKHPAIFQAFDELAVGESFVLVNNHDPRHLRDEFDTGYPGSYGWDYLVAGPEAWRIRIRKLATTPLPRILCDTAAVAAGGDPDGPDAAGAVWKLPMRERDLDSNIIRLQPAAGIGAHAGPISTCSCSSSTAAASSSPSSASSSCTPGRSYGCPAAPGASSPPARTAWPTLRSTSAASPSSSSAPPRHAAGGDRYLRAADTAQMARPQARRVISDEAAAQGLQ